MTRTAVKPFRLCVGFIFGLVSRSLLHASSRLQAKRSPLQTRMRHLGSMNNLKPHSSSHAADKNSLLSLNPLKITALSAKRFNTLNQLIGSLFYTIQKLWYRVGGGVTPAVLPHHRAYGSVHGGSCNTLKFSVVIQQRHES